MLKMKAITVRMASTTEIVHSPPNLQHISMPAWPVQLLAAVKSLLSLNSNHCRWYDEPCQDSVTLSMPKIGSLHLPYLHICSLQALLFIRHELVHGAGSKPPAVRLAACGCQLQGRIGVL